MKGVLYILLIAFMSPFVTYFVVKFGSYAYLSGKRKFNEDYDGKNNKATAEEEA